MTRVKISEIIGSQTVPLVSQGIDTVDIMHLIAFNNPKTKHSLKRLAIIKTW